MNVRCVPGTEYALRTSALRKVEIWGGRLISKQAIATRSGKCFDRKKMRRIWEPTGGNSWGRELCGTFQA